jgi:Tol biopolymer transport system component/DNA-binding winged helix-turn-helix (wHTH) protein
MKGLPAAFLTCKRLREQQICDPIKNSERSRQFDTRLVLRRHDEYTDAMRRATPGQNIRFGLFTADLTTGELFKSGQRMDLERQPFLILSALLRADGQLVTREELQSVLWPDGSSVDFNSGLNVAIKKLRDALGDSAENPRFIETLPRRGYRFIAPTEPVPDETQHAALGAAKPAKMWLSLALTAVTVICLSYWRAAVYDRADLRLVEVKPIPLTSSPGNERSPALSPDGKRVAYSWNGASLDNADIHVKFTGNTNPVRLTTDPAVDDMPVWSPDGKSIAFVRTGTAEPLRSTIRVIPALGGPERELVELAPGECYRYGSLSWSPDGEWVAFADRRERGDPFAIHMISLQTGEKRKVTSPPAGVYGDEIPKFSPDGRSLCFARLTHYLGGDLYVMPVTGSEPRRLTQDGAGLFGLSWTEDGKELVFSSDREGTARLWRIEASGGKPKRVAGITGSDLPRGIAQKANMLVFSQEVSDINIWRVDVNGPKMTGVPKPIAGSTKDDTNPQLSPDGQHLALMSNRSGSFEIWVTDPDGSNPMPLTAFGHGLSAWPAWSPDSRSIAFNSDVSGNWKIYVVDARGGKPRLITPAARTDASAPSWSPDGKWIYFQSTHAGVMHVWKMPVDGGPPIRLTKEYGWWPVVSRDGEWVYFARGAAIWKIPAAGGEEKLVQTRAATQAPVAASDWVQVRGGLYFQSRDPSGDGLDYLDFRTERVSRLMRVDKDWDLAPITASPDAKYLLFAQKDQGGADLLYVENFH